MSGTGQAGQAYVNQRAGNSSGLTQFLKLDGAFKQAIMLQRQKDLEEGRRLQYSTEAKATEGGLDRTSAEKISTDRNATAVQVAGMKPQGGLHSDINIIAKAQTMAAKELNVNAFSKMDPDTEVRFKNRVKEIASAIFKANGITPSQEIAAAFGGFNLGDAATDSNTINIEVGSLMDDENFEDIQY